MESKAKANFKKAYSIVVWVILAVLVFSVFRILINQVRHKPTYFFGHTVVRITSYSMVNNSDKEKGINVGEYILIKKTDAEKIQKGDIITFYSIDKAIENQLNTHRVYDKEYDSGKYVFTTIGDNNGGMVDEYKVSEEKVVGVMTKKLMGLTKIVNFFSGYFVIILIIIIPLLLFTFVGLKGNLNKVHEEEIERKVKEEVEKLKNGESKINIK